MDTIEHVRAISEHRQTPDQTRACHPCAIRFHARSRVLPEVRLVKIADAPAIIAAYFAGLKQREAKAS